MRKIEKPLKNQVVSPRPDAPLFSFQAYQQRYIPFRKQPEQLCQDKKKVHLHALHVKKTENLKRINSEQRLKTQRLNAYCIFIEQQRTEHWQLSLHSLFKKRLEKLKQYYAQMAKRRRKIRLNGTEIETDMNKESNEVTALHPDEQGISNLVSSDILTASQKLAQLKQHHAFVSLKRRLLH